MADDGGARRPSTARALSIAAATASGSSAGAAIASPRVFRKPRVAPARGRRGWRAASSRAARTRAPGCRSWSPAGCAALRCCRCGWRAAGSAPTPHAAPGGRGVRSVAASAARFAQTAAHPPRHPAARIGSGCRPDGDRLAAAGRAGSGQRARRAGAGAGRGDPRPRTRAHPPARLPGEPAADAGGDAALLPSRRVVAVEAHSRRAGELLRRSGRQPLRRSVHAMPARSPTSRSCADRAGVW